MWGAAPYCRPEVTLVLSLSLSRARARSLSQVRGLRELLRRAVAEKLENPEADISSHPAVSVLLQILAFE